MRLIWLHIKLGSRPSPLKRTKKSEVKAGKALAETSREIDVDRYRCRVDVRSMSRDVSAKAVHAFAFNSGKAWNRG